MSVDLSKIADRVAAADPRACRVVTGFDGFVDEMISLVGERRALDDFTPVPDIATFGAMISAAAGHSSLREIVVTDVHPGGCAVNLADGLASLGVAVDCFATLGEPVHSAYAEIAAKCQGFHSWGREPGRTLAFEFNDGKLMFSAVKQLADFTPDAVRGFLADGKFAAACAGAQVIALTDWTLYPHMTEVWKMLQREVFSKLTQRPEFFIDLVDPSSRSARGHHRGGRHSPRVRAGRAVDARPQWQRGEHPLPPARFALRAAGSHAGRDLAAGVFPTRSARHQPRGRPPDTLRRERLRGGRIHAARSVLRQPEKEHRRGRPLQRRLLPRSLVRHRRCGIARARLRRFRVLRPQRPQRQSFGTGGFPPELGGWGTGKKFATMTPFGQLASRIAGELHTGSTLRRLYSTDASEYQEMPAGVVFPKSENDLREIIRFANRNRLGLIPRTAGTSLAGQCVGSGLVVDVSKHFTKILSVDGATRRVRVQPGVVRNELNHAIAGDGLFFGPETSTANRAMIGGMMGNNSCGSNSIVYGSTREHLISVRGFLSDGSEATFCALTPEEFEAKCETFSGLETQIYRRLRKLLSDPENRRQIRENYPLTSIPRRNTGYALDLLMDADVFDPASDKPFNLCKLIAGSEGTCFSPPRSSSTARHSHRRTPRWFAGISRSINESLQANLLALPHDPSACELIDRHILDCTKSNLAQMRNRDFVVGDPGAILVVEIRRDTRAEAEAAVAGVIADWKTAGFGYATPVLWNEEGNKVWELRRAGQGLDEQRRRRCQAARGRRGYRRGCARSAGLHRRVR